MKFIEYQEKAHGTSLATKIGESTFLYPVLGLVNEAGEVAGKIKKLYRDGGGIVTPEFKEMLRGELGDVLWYLSEVCTQLDITLDQVAIENIAKLESRKARNVIQGSGDNR